MKRRRGESGERNKADERRRVMETKRRGVQGEEEVEAKKEEKKRSYGLKKK